MWGCVGQSACDYPAEDQHFGCWEPLLGSRHIASWSQSDVLPGREQAKLNCNLSDEVDSVRTCIIGQHRVYGASAADRLPAD